MFGIRQMATRNAELAGNLGIWVSAERGRESYCWPRGEGGAGRRGNPQGWGLPEKKMDETLVQNRDCTVFPLSTLAGAVSIVWRVDDDDDHPSGTGR
jgi:hypothetical protein